MSDWLKLGIANAEQPAFSGELQSSTQASPYEIPVAFRAFMDKDSHQIHIQFRYLDRGEPGVLLRQNQDVSLMLGQNSKRLLAINIYCEHPEDSLDIQRTLSSDSVRNALHRLRKESHSDIAKENYEFAGNIVDSQKHRILGELLTAS